jgi:hypothetical protein
VRGRESWRVERPAKELSREERLALRRAQSAPVLAPLRRSCLFFPALITDSATSLAVQVGSSEKFALGAREQDGVERSLMLDLHCLELLA